MRRRSPLTRTNSSMDVRGAPSAFDLASRPVGLIEVEAVKQRPAVGVFTSLSGTRWN